MRIVAAILVWIVLVGGVSLYMARREMTAPPREYVRPEAPGIYALDVTASFSVVIQTLDRSRSPLKSLLL